jgi:hypothetical protein
LRDVSSPTVTDLLWNYPGVRDLAALPTAKVATGPFEDVFDDIGVRDVALVGRDAATPREHTVQGFRVIRVSGPCYCN